MGINTLSFRSMEYEPYLGGDEQFFSLDDAVIKDFLQSNTDLGTEESSDLHQQECHRRNLIVN